MARSKAMKAAMSNFSRSHGARLTARRLLETLTAGSPSRLRPLLADGAKSVVDGLIGRGPEVAIDGRAARRIPEALRHQDRNHVLLGIRMGRGAIATVP